MKIEKFEDRNKNVLEKAMNGIFEENDREHNIDIGFEAFAYALKNDNDEIVGGIHGWKAFAEIYVDELCVDRKFRGLGYGKKLLTTVETEINGGDCDNINLVTNAFQNAVKFYEKCGFEVEFIRKNKKNPLFDKYYMVKKL